MFQLKHTVVDSMAEYEAPSEVENEESAADKLPPGGSQVELTNFDAGREGLSPTKSLTANKDPSRNRHGGGARTDALSTSAEAVRVSAVASGSEPHASLISQLRSLSLAPSVPLPTPSSTEDHDIHIALHTGGHGGSDASHMQGGPEKLLTPEEDGNRDGLASHEPGPSTSDSPQELAEDTALQRVDSGGSSFAVSSPIATPTGGNSRHESIASTEGQSYGQELGVSPYVVVKKELADVSKYESPGLLYARATQEKHNWDMLKPADEVAVDVLELLQEKLDLDQSSEGEEEDEEERERRKRRKESLRESGGTQGMAEEEDMELEGSASFATPAKGLAPIDPNVLHDLERHAQSVAANLVYIMDNLRNSLHAMTVCAQQSVVLHGEAVDNLHSLVDSNVKATYAFLARFEELQRHTRPLNDLAQQIKDINDTLKVLERNFRTT